jgi:NodT family efflux transporter outer membrane factor (OMF) lipoprotein
MRALILCLAGLSLAACTAGPAYVAPALEVPAAYRAVSGTAPAHWPGAAWWKGFNSPDLDRLIADATAGNFDIQVAIAKVAEADAQLALAGGALLPGVTLGATDQWTHAASRRASGGTISGESRSYSLGPSVSWEVDLWGKLRATRDAAAAAALASRYDQDAVALTTVAAVASTWFQALAQQDRVDVARRNLADAEEILKAINARETVGTASELDVSQQGALVAGLKAQIPSLQNQLEQYVIALGLLTGRPPSAITVKPGTLTALSLPPVAPGLPSALLSRRPDVAAAEASLIAAHANIRAARAAFYPDINLTGSAGWQSLALATLFGPGTAFANAALSATQTIFDNGKLSAQLAFNQATYDELLATYRKAVVQAFTDVENAATAYRYATEQETLETDAVKVAQHAADIAEAQVREGTLDLVSALQAQTTLFNDLDLLAQVRLARFQALLALYQAVGGGWTVDDVTAPAIKLFQGAL